MSPRATPAKIDVDAQPTKLKPALDELDVPDELDKIARGLKDADAQRLRTLFYLDRKKSSEVQVPPPMTDVEWVERMSRLMRSRGPTLCQLAYREAFPSRRSLIRDVPLITEDDLDLRDVTMPVTLKQLFKLAPEIHGGRGGIPKGYPRDGAEPQKTAWVQAEYIRYLKWKKNEALRQAAEADEVIA